MHDARSMDAKNAIVMNECEGVMQGARSILSRAGERASVVVVRVSVVRDCH
jgi:hypothetical protein